MPASPPSPLHTPAPALPLPRLLGGASGHGFGGHRKTAKTTSHHPRGVTDVHVLAAPMAAADHHAEEGQCSSDDPDATAESTFEGAPSWDGCSSLAGSDTQPSVDGQCDWQLDGDDGAGDVKAGCVDGCGSTAWELGGAPGVCGTANDAADVVHKQPDAVGLHGDRMNSSKSLVRAVVPDEEQALTRYGQVVRTLAPGDSVGELALLQRGSRRTATALVLPPSRGSRGGATAADASDVYQHSSRTTGTNGALLVRVSRHAYDSAVCALQARANSGACSPCAQQAVPCARGCSHCRLLLQQLQL
jgi:hypothetical protein